MPERPQPPRRSRPVPPGQHPPQAAPAYRPQAQAPRANRPQGNEFNFGPEAGSGPDSTLSHLGYGSGVQARKSNTTQTITLVCLGALGLALLGGVFWLAMGNSGPALQIASIPTQTVEELKSLEFQVPLAKAPEGDVRYELLEAPPGAKLDPQTGKFTWTPTEVQGPNLYKLTVQVSSGTEIAKRRVEIQVREQNQPPQITAIPEQNVGPGELLQVQIQAHDPDQPAHELVFSLVSRSASGAKVDSSTGLFEWTPRDADSGKRFPIEVRVMEKAVGGQRSTAKFIVRVEQEIPKLALPDLMRALSHSGAQVQSVDRTRPAVAFAGNYVPLTINGELVELFEYENPPALARDVSQVASDASSLFGEAQVWKAQPHFYQQMNWIALYQGTDSEVLNALHGHFGAPFAEGKVAEAVIGIGTPLGAVPRPVTPSMEEPPAAKQQGDEEILDLYEKDRLTNVRFYPNLRKIFADRFFAENQQQIKTGLGDAEYAELMNWFAENPDIKEELFLAVDPQYDNVGSVFRLFNEIRKKHPEKIVPYSNLAIAISVVWDNERALYHYDHHARRTHSQMPSPLATAMENFEFFLETEQYMQGRPQFLPWEFQVHLVNHNTPIQERMWALQNYLPKRVMFGKCYHDVPYDYEMLATGSQVCRLADKDYTLPNIRSFGGVCAMQADFAGRVGKSLGVPAEYVRGQANSGAHHAWVMWVELLQVTRNSIRFELKSHGRYNIDKYYVGTLIEPQTGQRITDRALELHLQNIGTDPIAARQADLIMEAFPTIVEQAELDPSRQLVLLSNVTSLSPGNQGAWIALSKMCREGKIPKTESKRLRNMVSRMFTIFANFPDFTWQIFDDLVAFLETDQEKIRLYEQLVQGYEAVDRPDLACEARLRLTDYLLEAERKNDAIEGLALTIRKFPDEGRYVPRMLDRLEQVAADTENVDQKLVQFYHAFLPTIPQMRGDTPSDYCISMFERGIKLFKERNQPALAQAYESELAKIRAGLGKNPPQRNR